LLKNYGEKEKVRGQGNTGYLHNAYLVSFTPSFWTSPSSLPFQVLPEPPCTLSPPYNFFIRLKFFCCLLKAVINESQPSHF
jgi:hypothetical protein